MNALLVFTVLFAGTCMADVSHIIGQNSQIPITKSVQDIHPDGAFNYAFETGQGISVQAQGLPDGEMQGTYRYISPDGTPIDVIWTAGKDGFAAQGASIPPTPESVLRTLEYNAAHPYKEPVHP